MQQETWASTCGSHGQASVTYGRNVDRCSRYISLKGGFCRYAWAALTEWLEKRQPTLRARKSLQADLSNSHPSRAVSMFEAGKNWRSMAQLLPGQQPDEVSAPSPQQFSSLLFSNSLLRFLVSSSLAYYQRARVLPLLLLSR